ncbi:VOC family protein [Nocardia sp. NPDC020380]|uniref:VOC family protein n=1 Tax=Nocardia sp. NPDC020380 TaxID=3364309 RepID=UPI003797F9E9
MSAGLQTILYTVNDLEAAKAVFTAMLGVAPIADAPYYVGWNIDGQDIGLIPNKDGEGALGSVAYAHVADIRKSFEALLDAGAIEKEAPHGVGGGRLVASVEFEPGNVVGILQNP